MAGGEQHSAMYQSAIAILHVKKIWFIIKDMDPWIMDLLLDLLLELLLELLVVLLLLLLLLHVFITYL